MMSKEELNKVLTDNNVPSITIEFILSSIYKDEVDAAWNWVVTDYIPLFKEYGKANPKREVITRMKKFFAENPSIRADEVIGATKMYIKATNTKFIRESRYFIHKGVGTEKISDLLNWVEMYRELNLSGTQDRDITRKLQ